MLLTFLVWLLIFLTVFPYGLLALSVAGWLGGRPAGRFHPVFIFISGLALLTAVSDLVSLFSPLDRSVSIGIMAGAVVLWVAAWTKWKNKRLPARKNLTLVQWSVALLAVLIFFSVLDLASRTPSNPDTAIYHAQAIHWIESYKAVPGLGNLTTRLAYNSNWFIDNALFGFAWLQPQPFHALPGLLVILSLFYFLDGTWQLASANQTPLAWLKTVLIPVFFLILPSEISSPGTDLPAILLTWLLLSEYLQPAAASRPDSDSRQLILGLLVFYAVTLKLSVLPLLILPGCTFIYSVCKHNFRLGAHLLALGALVLSPWLARNVILSGYLVYPVPWLDFFNFDWKIPNDLASAEVLSINNWARHIWIDSSQHNYALPFPEWVPLWFKAETLNRKIMALLAASGIVATGALLLIKPARLWLLKHGLKEARLVYITAYCGCFFWFFTAPDFRFGFSFIIFSILLIFYPLFHFLEYSNSKIKFAIVTFLLACLILNQAWFYSASFHVKTIGDRLIQPETYMRAPSSSCQFANFNVWCADLYNQCWYSPFPCVPMALPEVEMRGTDFSDGFRSRAKN